MRCTDRREGAAHGGLFCMYKSDAGRTISFRAGLRLSPSIRCSTMHVNIALSLFSLALAPTLVSGLPLNHPQDISVEKRSASPTHTRRPTGTRPTASVSPLPAAKWVPVMHRYP